MNNIAVKIVSQEAMKEIVDTLGEMAKEIGGCTCGKNVCPINLLLAVNRSALVVDFAVRNNDYDPKKLTPVGLKHNLSITEILTIINFLCEQDVLYLSTIGRRCKCEVLVFGGASKCDSCGNTVKSTAN